jgi:hypothetical protein
MGMDMDHDKKACGIVNFFCGDEHHPDHKDDCCDPCESLKHGNSYVAATLPGTALNPVDQEIPLMLLFNPVGSGKVLNITHRAMSTLGSDDESGLYKFYVGSVLASQGVLGAAVNLNLQNPMMGSGMAQLFSAPIPAVPGVFGTLIDGYNVAVTPYSSDVAMRLDEGQSILVTGKANAINTLGAVGIFYTECRKHMPHPPMV